MALSVSKIDELMAKVADGDRASIEPLFYLLQPKVSSFVQRALKRKQDAEDVSQAVLMKVFGQAHKYDPNLPALPWIFTIAGYECKTENRKAGRRKEDYLDEKNEEIAGNGDPETALTDLNLRGALRDTLEELSPSDLEAILASVGEMDRPKISGPAFRKRLQRAMGNLKVAWRSKHET